VHNRSNPNRRSCQCTTKSGCLPYLFAGSFEGCCSCSCCRLPNSALGKRTFRPFVQN